MPLTQSTAPTVAPVTLQEAKHQLSVDHADSDVLLEQLIAAAWQYAEQVTRRQLITATWTQTFDQFPPDRDVPEFAGSHIIELRKPPLQSVSSVKYYDTGGVQQTMSSGDYDVDTAAQPGRLVLGYQKTWPTCRGHINDVEIIYVAGFGTAETDVPDSIRQGILMLVAHWHENREATISGTIIAIVPLAVDSLFMSERVYGFI